MNFSCILSLVLVLVVGRGATGCRRTISDDERAARTEVRRALHDRGELETGRGDYLAAIDSLTRALAINQTAAALAKRVECYRKLGLLVKAEDDQKAIEQLGGLR